ncbi:hypothetical protein Tco_0443133 [Tanacetum coccineum]
MLNKLRASRKEELTYRLEILEAMLNDKIKKLDAYKVYLEKRKDVDVPMDQSKLVEPTQGMHRKSRASGVRKTGGKGPMMRSKVVAEHVDSLKTTIILNKKKKVAPFANVEKETYVDDPEQVRVLIRKEEWMRHQTIPYLCILKGRKIRRSGHPRDVGLSRIAGTSGLNFYDGSSKEEKPCGDSADLDRFSESQMVII